MLEPRWVRTPDAWVFGQGDVARLRQFFPASNCRIKWRMILAVATVERQPPALFGHHNPASLDQGSEGGGPLSSGSAVPSQTRDFSRFGSTSRKGDARAIVNRGLRTADAGRRSFARTEYRPTAFIARDGRTGRRRYADRAHVQLDCRWEPRLPQRSAFDGLSSRRGARERPPFSQSLALQLKGARP